MEHKTVRKPDFIIVGMPRSGTTSMYTYLKQHPGLYLSVYKEPHFFGKDLTPTVYGIREEDVYYSLFSGAGEKQLSGEASVWTMASRTAAAEIYAVNPAAKIIIMLRNPIDMIYSLHDLYLRTGNEDTVDFQQALEKEPQRKQGSAIPPGCYFPEGLCYTEVGRYNEKVERLVEVFGMGEAASTQEGTSRAVHVVIFDEFVKETASSVKGVLEFLGVDPGVPLEFEMKKALAMIRPQVLKQLRRARPEVRKLVALKPDEVHMGSVRPPMSRGLRSHLKGLFGEDIEKTGQFIGKDLMYWMDKV